MKATAKPPTRPENKGQERYREKREVGGGARVALNKSPLEESEKRDEFLLGWAIVGQGEKSSCLLGS